MALNNNNNKCSRFRRITEIERPHNRGGLESAGESGYQSIDDDYMAPVAHFTSSAPTILPKFKSIPKVQLLSKRKISAMMVERTLESLSQPISSSNKGFQLLSKLGYKESDGLGKSNEGVKEPIAIVTRPKGSALGLGHEDPKLTLSRERTVTKAKTIERNRHIEQAFCREISSSYTVQRIKRDVHSVQKVIYELDLKKSLPVHQLTKHVHRKYVEVLAVCGDNADKQIEEDEEDRGEDDEEEDLETAEFLSTCLSYLRDTHCYCFYCGAEYENEEDLSSNCPGLAYDDH